MEWVTTVADTAVDEEAGSVARQVLQEEMQGQQVQLWCPTAGPGCVHSGPNTAGTVTANTPPAEASRGPHLASCSIMPDQSLRALLSLDFVTACDTCWPRAVVHFSMP